MSQPTWFQRLFGMRPAQQSAPSLEQQRKDLEEQIRIDRLKKARKLTESYADTDYWLTAYSDLLSRYKDGFALAYPITQPTDRRYGSNFPFWYSEQQLGLIRAQSRLVTTMSPNAQGLLNGLCSYVIGSGYKYDVVAKPDRDVPDNVLTKTQDIIDEFIENNSWQEMEQELFWRSREDGEFFLRMFVQENGRMMVRVIEPEQVFMPPGSQLSNYSYGIKTDADDVNNVICYAVSYIAPGGEGTDIANPMATEEVPAAEMVHLKVNTKRNIKRGLPDFSYDTLDAFQTAAKLRANLGEGSAVQAAIAGVRQHDAASYSQVDTFVNSQTDYAQYSPVTQRATDFAQIKSGTFVDIPKGMNFVPPPGAAANAINGHLQVFQALLRSAGNRHNAPEWLVSSDASNNNYASSMTAESPFLRHCKRLQELYKRPFLRVVRAAIENAIDAGRLPSNLLDFVDITATPPELEVQDRNAAATANQIYAGLGVKSRQTIAHELGLDWDTEITNQQEYAEQMGGTGDLPMPGMPGADAGPDGGPDGPDGQPGGPMPAPASGAALNGAQVQSLIGLATQAINGEIPMDSAVAIAKAAFPGVDPSLAASIFHQVVKSADAGESPEGLRHRLAEGRWVTMGAHSKAAHNREEGDEGKKRGGVPVYIDDDGTITKGPAHMTGKKPSEISRQSRIGAEPVPAQGTIFGHHTEPPKGMQEPAPAPEPKPATETPKQAETPKAAETHKAENPKEPKKPHTPADRQLMADADAQGLDPEGVLSHAQNKYKEALEKFELTKKMRREANRIYNQLHGKNLPTATWKGWQKGEFESIPGYDDIESALSYSGSEYVMGGLLYDKGSLGTDDISKAGKYVQGQGYIGGQTGNNGEIIFNAINPNTRLKPPSREEIYREALADAHEMGMKKTEQKPDVPFDIPLTDEPDDYAGRDWADEEGDTAQPAKAQAGGADPWDMPGDDSSSESDEVAEYHPTLGPVYKKKQAEQPKSEVDRSRPHGVGTKLALGDDGIDGTEISHERVPNGEPSFQYAVGKVDAGGDVGVFRRKGSERGTYGGWRHENDVEKLKPEMPATTAQTEPEDFLDREKAVMDNAMDLEDKALAISKKAENNQGSHQDAIDALSQAQAEMLKYAEMVGNEQRWGGPSKEMANEFKKKAKEIGRHIDWHKKEQTNPTDWEAEEREDKVRNRRDEIMRKRGLVGGDAKRAAEQQARKELGIPEPEQTAPETQPNQSPEERQNELRRTVSDRIGAAARAAGEKAAQAASGETAYEYDPKAGLSDNEQRAIHNAASGMNRNEARQDAITRETMRQYAGLTGEEREAMGDIVRDYVRQNYVRHKDKYGAADMMHPDDAKKFGVQQKTKPAAKEPTPEPKPQQTANKPERPAKKKAAEINPEAARMADKLAQRVVGDFIRGGFTTEQFDFARSFGDLDDATKKQVVKELHGRGLISDALAKQRKFRGREVADDVARMTSDLISTHKAKATNRHVPFTDSDAYKRAMGQSQTKTKPPEDSSDDEPAPAGKLAATRTRDGKPINFEKPITGPSGAKLNGYEWQWTQGQKYSAREDGMVDAKVSDWEKSEASSETGKQVVHQFHVTDKDGTDHLVSLEGAARMLGFAPAQVKEFKNVSSAVKTLAKNQMIQSALQQEADNLDRLHDQAAAKVSAREMPKPVVSQQPNGRWQITMGDYQRPLYRRGEPDQSDIEQTKQLWRENEVGKIVGQQLPAGAKFDQAHRNNLKTKLAELNDKIRTQAKRVNDLSAQFGNQTEATGEPKAQSFGEYRREKGVSDYTMDHSTLSPSGRVSGRAQKAAQDRNAKRIADYNAAEKEYQAKIDSGEIVDPTGKYTQPDRDTGNQAKAEQLRAKAKNLRDTAARGMQTRKLTKHAEELERQADELWPKQ